MEVSSNATMHVFDAYARLLNVYCLMYVYGTSFRSGSYGSFN